MISTSLAFLCLLFMAAQAQYLQYPQYPQYPYPNSYPRSPPFKTPSSIVEGTYTYIDPTGAKRTVHYTNDGANGFNVVQEEPVKPESKKPDKEDKDGTTIPPENKEGNSTTTPAPDSPKKENDKKKADNVRYVPVPVYPQAPQLSSRSFSAPYNPYAGYPYAYRPSFG